MLLEIIGIGKIKNSRIELNGLTVIAGNNNTGKSTFGKALYCMFNAFYDVEKKINNERVQTIYKVIASNITSNIPVIRDANSHNDSSKKATENAFFSPDEIRDVDKISKTFLSIFSDIFNTSTENEFKEKLFRRIGPDGVVAKKLQNILNSSSKIDKKDVHHVIITRYFREEFSEQINHINKLNAEGSIVLTVDDKRVLVNIINNECSKFSDELSIRSDAIYIDTPFALDDSRQYHENTISFAHRINLFQRLKKEIETTAIEEVLLKQKIGTLLVSIRSIIGGEFRKDNGDLTFLEQGMQKPIKLSNVSAGMKVFLIIKRLLENSEIKEHGVLILDEPEIHLHPEWQIKFAEILVLLQKEFNLTILLTTHSPYFLEAIAVYSKKHVIAERCKYYLAETCEDTADVRDVTMNIEEVYKQLAKPFQTLEDENVTCEDM